MKPEKVKGAEETLAGKLSARSGSALRAAKRSIDGSLQEPDRRRASGNERQNWSALFGTYDQKEGMHAFIEKRRPEFEAGKSEGS